MIFEAWFKFKGVDSREMGVKLTAAPETVRPERRINKSTIPGRNGALHTDEGVYESYTRTMECAVIKRARLDEIAAWLAGRGQMIFCTEPDKYYDTIIANQIGVMQMMRTFQRFMVTMECQPFKYSVNAPGDTMELTAATNILNIGTVYSQPLITLYGTGDITLNVNETQYVFSEVEDYISIDSDSMEIFKDSTNQSGKYYSIKFPRLEPGINSVSWAGNCSKIVIVPRWRWL